MSLALHCRRGSHHVCLGLYNGQRCTCSCHLEGRDARDPYVDLDETTVDHMPDTDTLDFVDLVLLKSVTPVRATSVVLDARELDLIVKGLNLLLIESTSPDEIAELTDLLNDLYGRAPS